MHGALLRFILNVTFYGALSWLVVLGALDVINFVRNFGPICASIGGGCQ